MALGYRAVPANQPGGATVTKQAGTASGDLIILFVTDFSEASKTVGCSGFTSQGAVSGSDTVTLLTRAADGSEGSTFTLTTTGTAADLRSVIVTVSGGGTAGPSSFYDSSGSVTAIPVPGITIGQSGAWALFFGRANNSTSFTPPSGFTAQLSGSVYLVADNETIGAGATGTQSVACTSGGAQGAMIAVYPPAVSVTVTPATLTRAAAFPATMVGPDPATLTAAAAFGAPVVRQDQAIFPATLAATAVFPAAVVQQDTTAAPATVAPGTTFGAVAVNQALVTSSFEGVTPAGTAITAGNSGGTSGTAFDVVTTSGTGTVTSAAGAAHGALCASIYDTTASNCYLQWTSAGPFGAQTSVYFRAYLYFTAWPASTIRLFNVSSNSVSVYTLNLNTAGKLTVSYASGSTTYVTFTAACPLNAWCRVEGFVVVSATVGQVSASLFSSSMDAVTADETHTSAASLATGTLAGTTTYSFGNSSTKQLPAAILFDDIGLSNAGPLGPSVVSGNATAAPSALVAAASSTGPAVSGAAVATPAAVSASAVFPSAAVSTAAGATVSAATVAVSAAVPAVTVAGTGTATPASQVASGAFPAPAVSGSATVTPASLTAASTCPAAVVSPGPATLAVPASAPAPAVSGATASAPATTVAAAAFPAPAVSGSATISAATVTATAAGGALAVLYPNASTTGPAAGGYMSLTPVTLSANQNINPTGNPSWVTSGDGGLLVSGVAFTITNNATITVKATVPTITFAGCSFNCSAGTAGANAPTVINVLSTGGSATFSYCSFSAGGITAARMMVCINQGADNPLTVTNCDIADMKQGVQLFSGTTSGVTIANNYMHNILYFTGDHSEHIYAGVNAGGSNITVSGNTLLNPLDQTATVYLHPLYTFTNCTITGNLLAGGDYTLYLGAVASTGIVVTNNAFSTMYSATWPSYPSSGYYGPLYTAPPWGSGGNTWAGNIWFDGPNQGLAIPVAGTAAPATLTASATVPVVAVTGAAGIAPPAVTASSAIGAVTAGGSGTASPATLTAAAAFPVAAVAPGPVTALAAVTVPAVSAQGSATASPATVITSAVFPAAVVTPGPATLTASAAFPVPVVRQDSTASPATLAVAAVVPAAAVAAAGNTMVLPAAVTATASVPAPVVRQDQAITPATLTATVSVPAPAAAGSALAAPATMTGAVSSPAPVVRQDQNITVLVASLTAAQPPPGLSGTLTAAAVNLTTAVPAPAVAGSAALATAGALATGSVPVPVVSAGFSATVTPDIAAFPAACLDVTVTGDANAAPDAVSAAAAIPAPAVTADGTVTADTLTAAASVLVPVVEQDEAIPVTPALAGVTIPVPAVGAGTSATVTPDTVAVAASCPALAVSGTASVAATPATLSAAVIVPAALVTAAGALATVTITGTFPAIDGTTQDGWVVFDPGTVLRNAGGHTILDGAATTQIRASVMVPIALPATDNTALLPGPGQWSYTARVHLGALTLTWTFELPASLGPAVDLSQLVDI